MRNMMIYANSPISFKIIFHVMYGTLRAPCAGSIIYLAHFSPFFIVFALTGLEHYFMHILLKRGSDNTAKCANHHKICHMRFI